jgi:hypothetical protein
MAILKKIRVHECLGEIRVHERSEEMCRFIERKMFHEIGQNSNVSVFSASSSSVVAVCVNKNSKHAVKWALDHLVVEGDQLMLIHVSHPTVAIPTPSKIMLTPCVLFFHEFQLAFVFGILK